MARGSCPLLPHRATSPVTPVRPRVARPLLRIPTSQSSMRLRRLGSQEVDSGDTQALSRVPLVVRDAWKTPGRDLFLSLFWASDENAGSTEDDGGSPLVTASLQVIRAVDH